MPEHADFSELASSDTNLAELKRLLEGWKCYGSPTICRVQCQGDELSDTLAHAYTAVTKEIEERAKVPKPSPSAWRPGPWE